ncbi:MAG: translocation/assembly module TamB domain-containing protein, partial [Acidocella sp.]|nr:translocation/assembly module TamB domain-containing protein [Acidocella sp.]
TAAAFTAAIQGVVAPNNPALTTDLSIHDLADFTPTLNGSLHQQGRITGSFHDFAVNTQLTGAITIPGVKSGPFAITVAARNLPSAPSGTLTGSGALAGAPLAIQADYTVDKSGAFTLHIAHATWRSTAITANLTRAAGVALPTGSAHVTVTRLADFAPFTPFPVAGSLNATFTNGQTQNFGLNLHARNLLILPSLGRVNIALRAKGPPQALAIAAQADLPALYKSPAKLALDGRLNLTARAAIISALTVSWHGLYAALSGPVAVTTTPGLAIRHLNATLNGAAIALDGTLTPRLAVTGSVSNLPASLASLFAPALRATGTLAATATLNGALSAPTGTISLNGQSLKIKTGPAAALPPVFITATAHLANHAARLAASLKAGQRLSLIANGLVPFSRTGPLAMRIAGATDLRLADAILAANGTFIRGHLATNLSITGTPAAPIAHGSITLADGAIQNIGSGLNLTAITADLAAAGPTLNLHSLTAIAGTGQITGQGSLSLKAVMPINITLTATRATPVTSDLITETLDSTLHLTGDLKGDMALGGVIKIDKANINIPKSLPPNVANLPILNETPPPDAAALPPPEIALNLLITANNQIFIRGDGLFAELGGRIHLTGTTAHPNPEGGFTLIRGNLALAGKALHFTQGNVSFNGDGFMPTLDLEATATSADNSSVDTLAIGGTAAQPVITLRSAPPLPSDEILAQLLFGQSTTSLSPFQAASLVAALAQLAGVGGGLNPLDKLRNALGLDQLSLGGSGSGPPSLQAGRYIAPGVYLGAAQATNGQGTQARVEINLYKGLKLQTATGTSSTGSGTGSSVGLTYQFNY